MLPSSTRLSPCLLARSLAGLFARSLAGLFTRTLSLIFIIFFSFNAAMPLAGERSRFAVVTVVRRRRQLRVLSEGAA